MVDTLFVKPQQIAMPGALFVRRDKQNHELDTIHRPLLVTQNDI